MAHINLAAWLLKIITLICLREVDRVSVSLPGKMEYSTSCATQKVHALNVNTHYIYTCILGIIL